MANLIIRKNQIFEQTFQVCEYDKTGRFIGVVSGMGKNAGKWDSSHSRRAAQRYAAMLRFEKPDSRFSVETST